MERENTNGFGLARLRKEGSPIHPDDLTWLCHCRKCKAKYRKQLKAYEAYWKKESGVDRKPES